MEILRDYDQSKWNRLLYSAYKYLANYGESVDLPMIWMIFSFIILTELRLFLNYTLKEPLLTQLKEALFLSTNAYIPFTNVTTFIDAITKMIEAFLGGLTFIEIRRRFRKKIIKKNKKS
jgi:hypothetical protein